MNIWKDNWEDTQRRFADWWNGKGFIVGTWGGVRLSRPHADLPQPEQPDSLEQQWTDLKWRAIQSRRQAAWTGWPLETLPVVDPWFGPGSLAMYLGSRPGFEPETVWFNAIESCDSIRFDPQNPWWLRQIELIDLMLAQTQGNYLVGSPDIAENWDVLGSLRDAQMLLMDMIERPEWVTERISGINSIFFDVYDRLYERIRAQDGRSMFGWFRTWAPGKVAKVQCDGCSMFSPEMFRQIIVPALAQQCDWLDYSLYHLDGSQCLDKLDALLEIESLTAIEWTPDPKVPAGGSSHWYDLYRRILAAGKRVQVLGASHEEIAPLLDAVGGDGIYFLSFFSSEAESEKYQRVVEKLRR